MINQLEQLRKRSVIVADTGDISSIKQYQPQDATTNPSLILKAAQLTIYAPLVDSAIAFAKQNAIDKGTICQLASMRLGVLIGCEILNIITGQISTEVDPRLSFDTTATIKYAQQLIAWYESLDVEKNRILIKVAATWEGVQAAKELQKLGINCNLTLVFNLSQARACADAGVHLISPFVGRISDWHKSKGSVFDVENDPGVLSVQQIFNYYKRNHITTIIMAASFRSIEQIAQLADCDRLTISPDLLDALASENNYITTSILKENISLPTFATTISEREFRWNMNQDEMANEKLAQGIRKFTQDASALEDWIAMQLV